MEHHRLSFYQPQYAPSYVDADQAKIDEIFASCDQLNTPTIDPDFFEGNLFRTATNEKVDLKPTKNDPIVDEFAHPFINADVSLNSTSNSTTASVYDRSANYSPYSEKLESSAININSPEMMPVSPNKICPLDSSYAFEDDPTTYVQINEYEQTLALYSSPAASSHCNSRSSSISSGSGDNTHSYEYLFASADSMDPSQMNRVPQSPASISSHYSTESTNKTFTNLDNVPTVQMVQIKQEPVDLYQPTTIEEFESVGQQYPQMQPQQHCLLNGTGYSTLNQNDIYYQYTTPINSLPSTVTSAIAQQQQQQQQQAVQRSAGQTSPTTSGSGKRKANAAFTATTSAAGSSSSNKKPRMTKREKQKMMESDISKFENENRDLRQSIDLLERQIAFCKRFLSENVAPVIQRQQQMGQHQFGSQQMVIVNEV